MAKMSLFKFFSEVKGESQKVTWPSKKEMIASTIAVFIMVTIAALFLFFADQVIAWLVNLVLSIGS